MKNLSVRYNVHKILTPSAVQALTDYHWPGNVRELHNVMERLVILCDDIRITREHVLDELGMVLPVPRKLPLFWMATLGALWIALKKRSFPR